MRTAGSVSGEPVVFVVDDDRALRHPASLSERRGGRRRAEAGGARFVLEPPCAPRGP